MRRCRCRLFYSYTSLLWHHKLRISSCCLTHSFLFWSRICFLSVIVLSCLSLNLSACMFSSSAYDWLAAKLLVKILFSIWSETRNCDLPCSLTIMSILLWSLTSVWHSIYEKNTVDPCITIAIYVRLNRLWTDAMSVYFNIVYYYY